MRIVTNQKKINRNHKIGLYTSLASLIFLFGAVGLTLTFRPEFTNYSFLAMLAGLILSQVGVYFANRWGKSPRVDERISQGLKGLDDSFKLYHYTTPVPHLLTGPAGVWVLVPQYQSGVISYEKNRYRQEGVGIFAKFVGQEGIGKPDAEAKLYEADLRKFLEKQLPAGEVPEINTVIVFTSAKAKVQTQDAPVPTLHVDKLKDFIRRRMKEKTVSMKAILPVNEVLPNSDVE